MGLLMTITIGGRSHHQQAIVARVMLTASRGTWHGANGAKCIAFVHHTGIAFRDAALGEVGPAPSIASLTVLHVDSIIDNVGRVALSDALMPGDIK